jgi:hypothetical protein
MSQLRIHDQVYECRDEDGLVVCDELGIRCKEEELDIAIARFVDGKSVHQCRVERFMRRIEAMAQEKHLPPDKMRPVRYFVPEDLSDVEAEHWARIMLEEMLEMVRKGLGVDVVFPADMNHDVSIEQLVFRKVRKINPVQILDGACDVFVTTTGTLSCCGLKDEEALRRVDENNLTKFGPGAVIREDGKLVKAPDFVGVVLEDLI